MRNVILLLIRTNFVVIFHPILLADINNKKNEIIYSILASGNLWLFS